MKRFIYTTVIFLCMQLGVNFANAQEKILISTAQRHCDWNVKAQDEKNCIEEQKEYTISINKTNERIHITHPVRTDIFKIVSTEEATEKTIFKVIKATGEGKTITYNSVDGWIKVSDELLTESSVVLYYFTNK